MITGALMAAMAAFGMWYSLPYSWAPIVVSVSSFIFYPLQPWADSERLGANIALSAFLKMIVQLCGLIAAVGFWACLVLLGYWLTV